MEHFTFMEVYRPYVIPFDAHWDVSRVNYPLDYYNSLQTFALNNMLNNVENIMNENVIGIRSFGDMLSLRIHRFLHSTTICFGVASRFSNLNTNSNLKWTTGCVSSAKYRQILLKMLKNRKWLEKH